MPNLQQGEKIYVDTPIGMIEIYRTTDPDHPGIFIDFEGESVALVEYDSEKGIRTLAWNNQDEDYQTETIFDEDFPGEPSVEDEKAEQAFFDAGNWVENPEKPHSDAPDKYLWDGVFSSEEYVSMFNRCGLPDCDPNKLYIYSLTEEDGIGTVEAGKRYVNRIGYFFSKVNVNLSEPFRYW